MTKKMLAAALVVAGTIPLGAVPASAAVEDDVHYDVGRRVLMFGTTSSATDGGLFISEQLRSQVSGL